MSDIDFEELDQAVNKLVGKNTADEKPDASSEAVEVTQNEPNKTEEKTSKPESQAIQKSKGRFMDVFHHSSDMIGTNIDSPAPTNQAAPGPRKVISPTYHDVAPSADNHSLETPLPPADNKEEPPIKNDWPDPIDAAAQAVKESDNADTTAKAMQERVDPSSLFLPDTKVEKRPLGGFSGDHLENSPEKEEESKKSEAEKEPTETNPDTPNQEATQPMELPPELEAALVAIEEGDSIPSIEERAKREEAIETKSGQITEALPSTPEADDAIPEPIISESPKEVKAEAASPKPELSGLLGAGSIPQQYKTAAAPAETNEASHPIFFDADQYTGSPDAHAHKKKSGKTTVFQWIFIIVGLLLLGATLGAALFVFVSSK